MKATMFSLGILISLGTMACDICGCRIGMSGLNGDYRMSTSIGLSYQQSFFRSLHASPFNENEFSTSNEWYRFVGLNISYAIGDRWMISAMLPYAFNSYEFENELNMYHALGDASINTTYRAFSGSEDLDAILDLTAGIKLPTGSSSNDWNYNVPSSSLPGTGSVDFRLGVRGLMTTSERWSSRIETLASLNTRNPDGVRYGSQFQMELGERYQISSSSEGFNSWIDLSYFLLADAPDSEITHGVREDFPNSGEFHMIGLNLIGQYGNFALSAKVLIPFSQNFSQGLVEAQTTTQLQLTYYFKTEQ